MAPLALLQQKCAEAAATLRELLLTAGKRGISVEDSFGHFDVQQEGVVDLSQFILGLRALGIPLGVEAASLLLRQLSETSTTHLTVQDFHRLCIQLPTVKRKKIGPLKGVKTSAKKYKPSVGGDDDDGGQDNDPTTADTPSREAHIAQAQGLPTWARDRSKRALKELKALAKKHKVPMLGPRDAGLGLGDSDDDDAPPSSRESTSVIASHDVVPAPAASEDTPELFDSFTIDGTTTLEYIILTAPVQMQDDGMDIWTGQDIADDQSKAVRRIVTPKSQLPLKLIVVLDVFQTLDMARAMFQPVFQQYTAAKILVVGGPRRTDAHAVLNNTLLASWMGQLVLHLVQTRTWSVQPKYGVGATPQLLLGFGSGASVAAHFALVTAPQQPKLHVLNQALHGLVLVNGFCCTDGLKAKVQQLLHGLHQQTNDMECHEQLLTMLFSDAYLNQVSREKALMQFFQHRRGFLDHRTRPLLLQRLKGVLKHQDLRSVLSNLHLPLCLVQSSHNAWVAPAHSVHFQDKRRLATTLDDVFDPDNQSGGVHVSWLKGGHELTQERPTFLPLYVDQLVTAIQTAIQTQESRETTTLSTNKRDGANDDDDVAKKRAGLSLGDDDDALVVGLSTTGGTPETDDGPPLHARVRDLVALQGIKGVRQELVDRGIDVPLGHDDEVLWLLHRAIVADEAAEAAADAKKQAKRAKELDHERQVARQEQDKLQKKLRDKARQKARFQKDAEVFKTKEEARQVQQKRADVEWRERSSMESEDQHSRRRQVYDAKLEQWRDTNQHALVTVEALEEERKEKQEEALAIQQGLDRAAYRASLQANLWALQRKMEEGQVSLRGDKEGYGLDCTLASENIPALVAGIHCVIHDSTVVRNQKQTLLAQQQASQERQHTVQAQLNDCSRMYQTLVRMLERAETEKVIAKPEAGGTVRLLPATPQALRVLREKINALHQEMAHMNSIVAVANDEVLMFDRAMQSITVLQKRTDDALQTLVDKAKAMITEANVDLSAIREEQEAEAEADSKRLTLLHTLEARMQTVADERKRILSLETPFVDTNVYIAGTLQRVEKTILQTKLAEEQAKLQADVAGIESLAMQGKTRRGVLRTQGITLTEALVSLLAADTQLQELGARLKHTIEHEVQTKAKENAANVPPSQQRSVDHIRVTAVAARTPTEKQWVALDRLLTPTLYVTLPEADIQEMRLDPLYHTELTAVQVARLLTLPPRINLALPFLKSTAEIHAHGLLRQYTRGDGEAVFNSLDTAFAPPLIIHDLGLAMRKQLGAAVRLKPLEQCSTDELHWRACDHVLQRQADDDERSGALLPGGVTEAELRQLVTEPHSDHVVWRLLYQFGSLAPPPTVVVETLAQIVAAPEHCTMLVNTNQHAKLLEATQCRLRARQSATHEFLLHASAVHLTISIVFEGKFTAVGYQVGRLAAMLYYMGLDTPQPLGQVLYKEVALNTRESLGRLILRHAPTQRPLAQGTYHLVIGCPSETVYSIVVNCHLVSPVSDFIKQSKQLALTQQARLPIGRHEIGTLWQSMRLAERKLHLVQEASGEALTKAKDEEAKMAAMHATLEATHASDEATTNRAVVLQAIRDAERAFTKQCKLHAIRQEEAKDIQKGLQHLASMHADLLVERARLEKSLRDFRQHLPDATGRVEGHTAGFKIGYALGGADYHVIKTAKMRWRDIAALKGQLRTLLTSAQRVRRKYKKDKLALSSIERQWILLDRIRFPDFYLWEQESVQATDLLHESTVSPPGMDLTTQEKNLLSWTASELERVLTAPVNQLRRTELNLRKIILTFRDTKVSAVPQALLASWRTKSPLELKPEQREWVAVERVLHPELYSAKLQPVVPTHWTKANLLALIKTPEEQISILAPKERHLRDLIWHYDNVFCQEVVAPKVVPVTHHAIAHDQTGIKVEVDVDLRCRLVLQELDRAMANHNDMMDSSILHSAPQRFPTKVLRLELEKELDRLLLAQLYERETAEWKALASTLDQKDNDESSDSDPEAQLARQAKPKKGGKVDTKKAKPSFQKQKRAIQDALVPKTIEQEQFDLERKQLGPNGCMACHSSPCNWHPYLGDRLPTIQHRVHLLKDEIERVKRSKEGVLASTLCLSSVRGGGGPVSLRKMDLFVELTSECREWEKHMRLRAIDTELHATYNWSGDHFETVALHGFSQMQQTEKVQVALTREQNTLVAQIVTHEVMEDILEFMLEGWLFGVRESQRKVQGFVPSVYREGPITPHVLRTLPSLNPDPLQREADELQDMEDTKAKFGTPLDKWTPIEVDAQASLRQGKAVQEGSKVAIVLDETEQALKFGLFCMTLMYFRGLSLLQKQKKIWNTQASKQPDKETKPITLLQLERAKQQARHQTLEAANSKAKAALDRKYQREQERMQTYRNKLHAQHRLAKQETKAAVHIQRVFRGFLGRQAATKWKIRRAELEALRALEQAAATTMQRAYRGRLGRLAAEARRIELAEFIAQIRAEEAIVEEVGMQCVDVIQIGVALADLDSLFHRHSHRKIVNAQAMHRHLRWACDLGGDVECYHLCGIACLWLATLPWAKRVAAKLRDSAMVFPTIDEAYEAFTTYEAHEPQKNRMNVFCMAQTLVYLKRATEAKMWLETARKMPKVGSPDKEKRLDVLVATLTKTLAMKSLDLLSRSPRHRSPKRETKSAWTRATEIKVVTLSPPVAILAKEPEADTCDPTNNAQQHKTSNP
ncbi:Aste57867_12289 [Aphanomyces stellatus]|uniref:Aste57867_12289 protein n=1 Tax=Aphanomyces stellatus TaxID=120398 RepID=A0A485KX67_9STRA|nr:hypothetical protein As57867_012244 [Aphanomyces stellatus]VFT89142.1 Aste57867_12289 [Aphanomyces stellatus]